MSATVFALLVATQFAVAPSGSVITHTNWDGKTYIVQLSSCASISKDLGIITTTYGGKLVQTWQQPICAGRISGWNAATASDVALNSTLVTFVETNGIYSLAWTEPLQPSVNSIPALDRVDQRERSPDYRFRRPHDGFGSTIYIVDSGINLAGVPEFAGRVGPGFSALTGSSATVDLVGHGTAMASIAASGLLGTSAAATVVPVKIADSSVFNLSTVVTALQFILSQPANNSVVNLSFSSSATSASSGMVELRIAQLRAAGFVVVAAAGNDGQDVSQFTPARSADAITVGGTVATTDVAWNQSNFGAAVDIHAPATGHKAYTTAGALVAVDGMTSGACAMVSGSAANLLQTGALSPSNAQAMLESAATTGVLQGLNGSVNRLLFNDVRPSLMGASQVGSLAPVLCTVGAWGGTWQPQVVAAQAVLVDAAHNVVVAYRSAAPPLCISNNPFGEPATTVLEKRDSAGALVWARVLSSGAFDSVSRLAFDPSGAVVGVGTTGSCGGAACLGALGAFIFKVSSTGTLLWTNTIDSAGADLGAGLVFHELIPPNGTSVLTVVGTTSGTVGSQSFGSYDLFAARVDPSTGAVALKTQFGTSGSDMASDLATFSGELILGGQTTGVLPGNVSIGGTDAFLQRILPFASSYVVSLASQFGTSANDGVGQIVSAAEPQNNGSSIPVLFASGTTSGVFSGQVSAGGVDGFAVRIDNLPGSQFQPTWIRQFGTVSDEGTPGLSVSPDDVFVGAGPALFKLSRVSGGLSWVSSNNASQSAVATDTGAVIGCGSDGFCTRRRAF